MVVKGDLKYPVELVLYEIYRTRGLTIEQMSNTIFDNKQYAFHYMKRLKEEGLIVGKILTEGKRRIAMQHCVTEKGIDYLEQCGRIRKYNENELEYNEITNKRSLKYETTTKTGVYIPRKLLALDNNNGYVKNKMLYSLYTNEIYAGITPYKTYFYDSREWKSKYVMNSNAMVRGGLKMPDESEYSLYVLFSKQNIPTAAVSQRILERIFTEMSENRQSGRHIVYVYDQSDYVMAQKFFEMNVLTAKELLIIPHGVNNIGIKMLSLLTDKKTQKKHIEDYLNVRLYGENEIIDTTAALFADYLMDDNGETFYIVDYLSLNELKITMLLRQYTREQYIIHNRKVKILSWTATESILIKKIGAAADYIEIVNVNMRLLNEWTTMLVRHKLYKDF